MGEISSGVTKKGCTPGKSVSSKRPLSTPKMLVPNPALHRKTLWMNNNRSHLNHWVCFWPVSWESNQVILLLFILQISLAMESHQPRCPSTFQPISTPSSHYYTITWVFSLHGSDQIHLQALRLFWSQRHTCKVLWLHLAQFDKTCRMI